MIMKQQPCGVNASSPDLVSEDQPVWPELVGATLRVVEVDTATGIVTFETIWPERQVAL